MLNTMLKTRFMVVLAVFLLGLATACGGSTNIDQDPSGPSQDAGLATQAEQLSAQPTNQEPDQAGETPKNAASAPVEQPVLETSGAATPSQTSNTRTAPALGNLFATPTETAGQQPAPIATIEAPEPIDMVDVQVGQQYESGTRVNFPSIGVSFVIPNGWFGVIPEGSQAFLLGSEDSLGLGMALSHQASEASALIGELGQPIPLDQGVTLQVQGQPEIDGSMIRAAISVSDGNESQPGHLLAVFRQGGGGVIFAGFGPDDGDSYQALIGDLASSVTTTELQTAQAQPQGGDTTSSTGQTAGNQATGTSQSAPSSGLSPIALQWDQHLRGMKVTYISSYSSGSGGGGLSTRIDYYLCRDGRFSFNDSSSVASSDSFSISGGGDLGSSGQGRWEIITEGEAVGIKLTWSDGRADLARLEFYDGGTYINGDRYYVTADYPNC